MYWSDVFVEYRISDTEHMAMLGAASVQSAYNLLFWKFLVKFY